MAQAVDRNMTEEFRQGSIDRSYIQVAPDVGGLVEMTWRADRAINQMPWQYLNAEVHGLDPFATAREQRRGIPVQPLSRYIPRRDPVGRETATGLAGTT